MNNPKHISVGKALFLFYLMSALSIIFVVTLSSFFSIKAMVEKERQIFVKHQVHETQQSISNFLNHRRNTLEDYAGFPILSQAVMHPEANRANVADFFDGLEIHGSRARLSLLDYKGDIIYTTGKKARSDTPPEKWLSDLLEGHIQNHMGVILIDSEYFWIIAVPVFYNGLVEGIFISEISITDLEQDQQISAGLGKSSMEVIFDSQVVFSSGPQVGILPEDYFFEDFNLTLRFYWNWNEMTRAGNLILFQTPVVVVFITLISFMVAFYLARRFFAQPLSQFRKTTHQLIKDYASVRAPQNHYLAELSLMATDFNKMADEIYARDQELRKARDGLEIKVRKRTEKIQHELDERKKAEKKLKKSELSLKRAKEEAESANRAKSDFLANMSHEIRTPMNAVLGFSELLTTMITDNKQKSYLNSIQTAGKNLLIIINDILDLSKIEAGRMDLQYDFADPKIVCNEIRSIFSPIVSDKNLEFITDIDPDLPPALKIDEIRVRQVLINLVGNAVKFTDKGHIRLSCRLESPGDDLKKMNRKNNDQGKINLVISVEDTGIGIPKDQQKIIFESFRQQEKQNIRKYEGTGLGLTITKRFIEMMGGTIIVKSEMGTGTVFEITLRDVEASSTVLVPETSLSFNAADISFEPAQILVVDDNKSNRDLIVESLSGTNLDVIEAEDGQKCLTKVQTLRPDLILMDIRMPVLDGYEATKKLKADPGTANIPIVALTASMTIQEKANIMSFGFDGFLFKPVKLKDLILELSRFLKVTKKTMKASLEQSVKEKNNMDEKISRPPELITRLEKEMKPVWHELDGAMEMDLALEFAQKLKKLALEYDAHDIIRYSEKLSEYIDSFDIEHIHSLLSEFPDLIDPDRGVKKS